MIPMEDNENDPKNNRRDQTGSARRRVGMMTRLLRRAGLFSFQVLMRPLAARAAAPAPGVAFRILEQNDVGLFADGELEVDEAKAREAFARGEVCVGALLGDALVGYAWFARDPAPHVDGIWMEFDRAAIYTYRAFVKPSARGRGIAPVLYNFADAQFMDAGRRYTILCIDVANRASLAAAERSGASAVGRAGYWRGFGGFAAFRSAGAAAVGFRFFKA
jgi:GNAT superfamily N-acetyltransferase